MAKRTKRLVVAGLANSETSGEILSGTEAEPKLVTRIMAYETSAVRQNNAQLVGYFEQLQVTDTDIRLWLNGAAAPLLTEPIVIPLDLTLRAGEKLVVGQKSGATATDMVFVAEYEIPTGV